MAENKVNPDRDSNPDPVTKAPGSHPVATGVGAAAVGTAGTLAGIAAGAAAGSVVPGIGTVIGGVVGAVVGSVGGGYAGKAIGEAVDPTGTDDYWQKNHQSREYAKGTNYDSLRPAYQYGSSLADQADSDTYDESAVRSNWEASPHAKTLDFDHARGAIRDEYDRKIKLREEQLRVSKDRVSAGEVSLRKEVTTENKTVQVPAEREELVISRTNVAGRSSDAGTIGDAEEIRVPLSEERVNVSKDTVVTGEVEVAKRKVTDTQTVSDSVRKESLKVDNKSGAKITETTGNA